MEKLRRSLQEKAGGAFDMRRSIELLDEDIKLLGNFLQAEIKMIAHVEANSARCGIPPQIADQLKAGHKNTEAMQAKVCRAAQDAPLHSPGLSEVLSDPKREPAGLVGDFPRLDRR